MKPRRPPKLPRFMVPKDMKSRVFKTKKDKANARQALNKLASEQSLGG